MTAPASVSAPEITVYTPEGRCQQCRATKMALDKAGLAYTELPSSSPEAQRLAAEHGITSAPLVVAGDQVWGGFRDEAIKALAA